VRVLVAKDPQVEQKAVGALRCFGMSQGPQHGAFLALAQSQGLEFGQERGILWGRGFLPKALHTLQKGLFTLFFVPFIPQDGLELSLGTGSSPTSFQHKARVVLGQLIRSIRCLGGVLAIDQFGQLPQAYGLAFQQGPGCLHLTLGWAEPQKGRPGVQQENVLRAHPEALARGQLEQ